MVIQLLAVAVMGGGIVGMLVCAKLREDHPLATRLLLPCLGLILVGAIIFMVNARAPNLEVQQQDLVVVQSRLGGLMLGRHLGKTIPNAIALIIVDDVASEDVQMKAKLEGLKEGLGEEVLIISVVAPEYPDWPDDPNYSMPPERKINLRKHAQAGMFDQFIAAYPTCNLIISLIGLPQNPENMAIWQIEDPALRPRLALFGCDLQLCQDAILSGAICAAVVSRPGFELDQRKLPRDPQAAFDRRFLLLTPENLTDILAGLPAAVPNP